MEEKTLSVTIFERLLKRFFVMLLRSTDVSSTISIELPVHEHRDTFDAFRNVKPVENEMVMAVYVEAAKLRLFQNLYRGESDDTVTQV